MRTLKMRNCLVLLTAAILAVLPASTFAQTELIGRREFAELSWGGVEHRWDDVFHRSNVRERTGPRGRLDLVLEDNIPVPATNTELLLHFDAVGVHTESDRYRIVKTDVFHSEHVEKHGRGSAGFLRYGNRVEIKPLESSVFFSEHPLQSFSIDFHLFPTSVHDSTVVLAWYAPTVDAEVGFSGIRAFFRDGRLHWEFGNVFREYGGRPRPVVIGELIPTPLHQWHHHGITYDALSGLITLTFDGRETNLLWTTTNEREHGNQLEANISPYLSGVSMILGEHFLGYMDEFRISRGIAEYSCGEYRSRGTARSRVIQLANRGSRIVRLRWDSSEEYGTAIRVYCRASNRYFSPDMEPASDADMDPPRENGELTRRWPPDPELSHLDGRDVTGALQELKGGSPPPWVPVINGAEFEEGVLTGRFVQWKVELYGTRGNHTPLLENLTLVYEPDPSPIAPILLAASPLDGGIELTWVKSREKDVAAYRIYYGERSRNYLAFEPIRVPQSDDETQSYSIEDLVNDRVYFVSMTAVDDDGQESGFSDELVVRPSSTYLQPTP
jgi:hypothetical protein